VTLAEAFAQLKTAMPSFAQFQGTHFKFAQDHGVTLIECRRDGRFFYWLIWEGEAKLVNASIESKFRMTRNIGQSFDISETL